MAAVRPQEASSSTFRYSYHVFLNFRGEDTRKTFIDHLYVALTNAGIRTFRDDDELTKGENIKSELEKAIEESKISIVVFAPNYAYSRWCLDELVKILEHKKNSTNHMLLSVFYHVSPTQVRYQTGSFADAFASHAERLKSNTDNKKRDQGMEKVESWKAALSEVANLSGMELQDGQEAKFIQNIVKEIVKKLKHSVLSVPDHLVGMEFRVSDINRGVQNGSNDVDIMVIYGMGGIGKTTIAKIVYNLNFDSFEGSSFLANIRDASEHPNGLVRLQRQLLSDILRGRKEKIYNVDEGVIKIRDVVSCKRILLVLDDMDQLDQLNALLGMRDWFHPGSKIIITTRHKHLIKSHEVCEMYKVNELDGDESLKLFSWYAFGQEHPNEDYVQHCECILQHCGGVPLALQVIGSFLSGKGINIWVSQLEKLETIGDGDIVRKLKISFDGLPDNDVKNVFLHVACFFVGEDKDWTIRVLNSCDLHTTVAIEHLVDRCLLHIDHYDNKLRMHQLIKDMGRYIVKEEAPDEPEKRSRLWHPKDCSSILSNKIGTETIKALVFDMRMFKNDSQVKSNFIAKNAKKRCFEDINDDPFKLFKSLKRRASNFLSWHRMENNFYEGEFETRAFTRMKQLKLLKLSFVKLKGNYKEFPKQLRWLCWHGFHLVSITDDLSLKMLVVLDMQYSSLKQVWKGKKSLPSLKILNLSHSRWISRTPNFSRVPNLERLILEGCVSLVNVCESIGFAEGLTLLDLSGCTSLKGLPRNISMLRCLEKLMISGCSSLREFPTLLRSMASLKEIYADRTRNDALIPLSREVQQWDLPGYLVKLSLGNCNLSDASFPRNFNNLPFLEYLNLGENLIRSLPECIRTHNRLVKLDLSNCPLLQYVEGLPSTIQDLDVSWSESLKRIITTSNLLELDCVCCDNLAEVEGCYKLVGIENVDKRIIKNLGLLDFQVEDKVVQQIKVHYEFGIFSTFIPGSELVGSWFDYKNKRPPTSISWTIPDNSSKRRIRGLNICYAYHLHGTTKEDLHWYPECKISNTTKDLHWVYRPHSCWWKRGDDKFKVGILLSHWRLGDLLEIGDHLTFKFNMGAGIEMKEMGLKVVYEEEDDDDEREETTTSQWYNFNNYDNNIVALSWTEEEETNSYSHLSHCRLSGTQLLFQSLWPQHILHHNWPPPEGPAAEQKGLVLYD